jgi:hypothetical protein
VLEFKQVTILAFAKIKAYFSMTYVKIALFKTPKNACLIDFSRLVFTKSQKISHFFQWLKGLPGIADDRVASVVLVVRRVKRLGVIVLASAPR